MLRIVRKCLHPIAQLRRMHLQVFGRLRVRDPAIPDQPYRLKLELPRKPSSLHDPPPVPSKHLTRCLRNWGQATGMNEWRPVEEFRSAQAPSITPLCCRLAASLRLLLCCISMPYFGRPLSQSARPEWTPKRCAPPLGGFLWQLGWARQNRRIPSPMPLHQRAIVVCNAARSGLNSRHEPPSAPPPGVLRRQAHCVAGRGRTSGLAPRSAKPRHLRASCSYAGQPTCCTSGLAQHRVGSRYMSEIYDRCSTSIPFVEK